MPSFDIVSEYDAHEANNAIDQANREVTTRFDFKGSDAKFLFEKDNITLQAQSEFQLQQMLTILETKLSKRGINIACMDLKEPETVGKMAKQQAILRQGLETDLSKKITKLIKEKKLKVQAAIQGEKVRVTGKKRDDLQQVISVLKDTSLDMPLQFNNFRD